MANYVHEEVNSIHSYAIVRVVILLATNFTKRWVYAWELTGLIGSAWARVCMITQSVQTLLLHHFNTSCVNCDGTHER